jgi:tRNA-dihydrouridine synthase B
VRIPVTVKMRAGWNEHEINAPELARMVEGAGAAAVAVHGRTAAQQYHGHADWDLIARVAEAVSIPVYGSGDLVDPGQMIERLVDSPLAGVLVGRGILRNPWLFAQAQDLLAGRLPRRVTPEERGRFLLEYLAMLVRGSADEPEGFRHSAIAPAAAESGFSHVKSGGTDVESGGTHVESGFSRTHSPARGRERWVINKLRALCGWYTKGFDRGAQLRVAVNRAESLDELGEIIRLFFAPNNAPTSA